MCPLCKDFPINYMNYHASIGDFKSIKLYTAYLRGEGVSIQFVGEFALCFAYPVLSSS